MISIGCLIYRSPRFADFVYESLHTHTPHLSDGRAQFYFVANDATEELKDHLVSRGYPHFVHENSRHSLETLSDRGIDKPEYLNRVYKACNRLFGEVTGSIGVYVSSDMAFSPRWLDALLEVNDGQSIVTSQLIEGDARANLAMGSIVGNYGYHPNEFKESEFLSRVESVRSPGTRSGGQYVPMLLPMGIWNLGGGFPEGNIVNGNEWGLAGDLAFTRRYAKLGFRHVTATDSVVYHFCEGEMRE